MDPNSYGPVGPPAPSSGQSSDGSGLGYAIAGGAALGGGLLSFLGGQSANENNAEQAALNRQWQDAEVNKSMQFQSGMRGSAWQATVADMKAAGINPMTAFSQGATSAPSVPQAGGVGIGVILIGADPPPRYSVRCKRASGLATPKWERLSSVYRVPPRASFSKNF